MRVFILISFALIVTLVAVGQVSVRPKAVLSRRLVTRGDMVGPLSEIYLDLAASAGRGGDMVAMRICSRDPLQVAIIEAVVDPVGIGTDLASSAHAGLTYLDDHILILRSPDCPVTHPPYVPVEFWGVPQGAELPSASEVARLCQLKVSGTNWFDVTGRKRNVRSYRAALRDLLFKLRENTKGSAVIYGRYAVRPSVNLKRSLSQAESYFRVSGLPRGRFFVRMKPWAYEGANTTGESQFPDLFIVHIAKDSDGE